MDEKWVDEWRKIGTIPNSMYSTRRRHWVRIAPLFAVGLLGILVVAPNAAGQAALKQYVPQGNPTGDSGSAGGSLANPITAGTGSKPIGSNPKGTDKGGTLPIVDYPGTPWLWIILAILVAGALIRGGFLVLKRRGLLGTT
jgi:hypothetical protein